MPTPNKKDSWKQKIDPAFDELIKIYRDFLSCCYLPKKSGYITIEDDSFKALELKGFPALMLGYKPEPKLIKKAAYDIIKLNKLDESSAKRILKTSAKDINKTILQLANCLEAESRDYYIKRLQPSLSAEQLKTFLAGKSEKEILELKNDLLRDFLTLVLRVGLNGYWDFKNEPKKNCKIDQVNIISICLSLIYDSISKLTYKKNLKELVYEAKKGNDDSLFKAMQIDKTLFDMDWVRKRVRKAQLSGDGSFFERLGDAIKKSPLENDIEYGELLLVLTFFWDMGLCRLENLELKELLEASGLKFQEDEDAFKKYVYRLRKENVLTD